MEDSLPPNDKKNSEPSIAKDDLIGMLMKRMEQLPEGERNIITYGSVYLGINSAFAGLIANSFFRRILNISQARFASSLPMAVLPLLSTVALYNAAMIKPMISGDLDCPTCVLVRGGLVASLAGGLYPIALAVPINAGLAVRYNTAPMPEKGNILQFWLKVCQPVLKKMSFVLILQAIFGVYLSSRQYGIYLKMLEPPATHTDPEELSQ
ncbi:transmembrane protein 126A [Callorhinchus milii]|uniref:Transmembrane protein n=1 Tax=Callorhinchus milii TaxID=7868 RepID=K4FYE0_CALMI|nr:transmembrane protein 126A [Callorhinchus milii]AFK11247.1 transmembrane protein [Callorhinchus milii]